MSNFYCAAPWRGLHINPQGSVKTCCAGDPNMLGNLNEQPIEEILHGPKLQEIRKSLREGKPHPYCYNCVKAERYGRSERQWHNELNPDFDAKQASDTEHIPVLVDVRWNITCNLSCNYCGDKCSSKWAALKHIPFKSGARPYYEQVCDYLEQHQASIKEVALVGGEPLLLPENERLLDVIPAEAVVTVITNLSVDLENNAIFKKLAQRKKVGWSLSFDNIGERLEYVRYGAKWELIERNVNTIKQLFAQGHWGGIHAVYNIYNCTRLVEFTQWARDTGVSIQWQSLYQPEHLDPLNHSEKVRALAAAEIDTLLETVELTDSERVFFKQARENYKKDTHTNLAKLFIREISDLEGKYHSDKYGEFSRLWPDLQQKIYERTPMIVNAVMQPVTNDSVYWLPSDTEELFQKNLKDFEKRKLLEEYGWIDAKIEYAFNSDSFRSIDFESSVPAVAVFGCSHTQGIGLHYHQLWHQHLSRRLGGKPIFNFGIGGASADTCYRLAEHYLPNLNVDTVIMLRPSETRLEFWNVNDSFPWFMNANTIPDAHKFFAPWYMDSRNAQMYAIKNVQSVAYICKMLDIEFYCYTDLDFLNCTTDRTYARDLLHRGEPNHIRFAEIVYNDIDFKRVYHPHWLNRAQPPRA